MAQRREEPDRLRLELRVGRRALHRSNEALADLARQGPGRGEAAQRGELEVEALLAPGRKIRREVGARRAELAEVAHRRAAAGRLQRLAAIERRDFDL